MNPGSLSLLLFLFPFGVLVGEALDGVSGAIFYLTALLLLNPCTGGCPWREMGIRTLLALLSSLLCHLILTILP